MGTLTSKSTDDCRAVCSSALPVLVFHKSSATWTFGVTNYSPARLRTVLDRITSSGYRFVGLETESNQAGEKLVGVSFDDGYIELAAFLPDLIERFHLQPTVFIPTAHIGCANSWDYSYYLHQTRHLDGSAIKSLSEAGVVFGSHGHRHVDLTRLNDHDLEKELCRSRELLEDLIGRPVTSISYPFGRCNRRVLEAAAQAGYQRGYTMQFSSSSDGPLNRGRLPVYSFDSARNVLKKIRHQDRARFLRWTTVAIGRLSRGSDLLNRLKNLARRQSL